VYTEYEGKMWRAPNGTCWRLYTASDNLPIWTLIRLEYNQDTGQWTAAEPQDLRDVPQAELKAYTEVPEEPLRDPRITRLASLVTGLLADYQAAAGTPAPNAADIVAALAMVAAIPGEAANKAYGAYERGLRNGINRSRRR
jgi:hypothetical protein